MRQCNFCNRLMVFFCVVFVIACCLAVGCAEAETAINEMNFPDEYFREYISEEFDIDEDGVLSYEETENIACINCQGRHIRSLKGIELLPYVFDLDCSNNKLEELDVSENRELIYLSCYENKLKELNVSKNTKLEWLDCSNNDISMLDLINNPSVHILSVDGNKLSALDISNLNQLETLYCSNNNLTALNLTNNPKLERIGCYANSIKSLELSGLRDLLFLDCESNEITELNLKNNINLETLYVYNNQLSSIDLSYCKQLTSLNISDNHLTQLDISNCQKLIEMSCSNNELTVLDLKSNKFIEILGCGYNKIKTLDLSPVTYLEEVYCESCHTENLILANEYLYVLTGWENNYRVLDISKCPILVECVKKNDMEQGMAGDWRDGDSWISVPDGIALITGDGEKIICHRLQEHEKVEPTLFSEGVEAYWQCSVCEKYFSDSQGKKEIAAPIVIPKLQAENIAEGGQCGEDAYYTLDHDGLLRILGTGDIEDCAFEERNDIKRVIIENGIIRIGVWAFSGCKQMRQIEIPESVEFIGTAAFSECSCLENLVIPGSVKTLESNTVDYCEALKRVELLEGVTTTGEGNFIGCRELTDVILPDSLLTIDAFSFQECISLVNIKIPDSVTYISPDAFTWAYNLSTIIVQSCNSYAYKWALDKGYSIEVQKHQHVVTDPYVAPTETEFGLTEGSHCTCCGEIIKAQEFIPGTGAEGKIKGFIARCYQMILGRLPDPGGMNTWYNELNSGRKTATEIIGRFINSPEFSRKNCSPAEAVDILYRAMLGRSADPVGKKNWLKKLEDGQSFTVIINGVCFSREFRSMCDFYGIKAGFVDIENADPTPEGGIKAFVQRCYRIILDREADPSGMETWYEQLSSGKKAAAEIIDRFVNSPEFSGKRYSHSDSVEILYKAMLGRGSDAAGKANWVGKLDAGQPFAVVINGFCVSKEFTGICASYGIKPGNVNIQLSAQSEEELSMLALNAKAPITRRSETKPNRVEIINPSDTIDMNIGTAVQAVYINEEKAKEFISRCYRVILGREASEAELENWIGQMVNGTKSPDQIARGFLFSNEFKAKNVSSEELVKILYRVYMNRDADPEGLKTWTEKLDGGTALKDLLDAFAKTSEFKKVISEMSK